MLFLALFISSLLFSSAPHIRAVFLEWRKSRTFVSAHVIMLEMTTSVHFTLEKSRKNSGEKSTPFSPLCYTII